MSETLVDRLAEALIWWDHVGWKQRKDEELYPPGDTEGHAAASLQAQDMLDHIEKTSTTPDSTVDCDGEDGECSALTEPVTPGELRAALEHWHVHGYLAGCSHGR